MSEISGKILIEDAKIETPDILYLRGRAFLHACTIYCKDIRQEGQNALMCVIHTSDVHSPKRMDVE